MRKMKSILALTVAVMMMLTVMPFSVFAGTYGIRIYVGPTTAGLPASADVGSEPNVVLGKHNANIEVPIFIVDRDTGGSAAVRMEGYGVKLEGENVDKFEYVGVNQDKTLRAGLVQGSPTAASVTIGTMSTDNVTSSSTIPHITLIYKLTAAAAAAMQDGDTIEATIALSGWGGMDGDGATINAARRTLVSGSTIKVEFAKEIATVDVAPIYSAFSAIEVASPFALPASKPALAAGLSIDTWSKTAGFEGASLNKGTIQATIVSASEDFADAINATGVPTGGGQTATIEKDATNPKKATVTLTNVAFANAMIETADMVDVTVELESGEGVVEGDDLKALIAEALVGKTFPVTVNGIATAVEFASEAVADIDLKDVVEVDLEDSDTEYDINIPVQVVATDANAAFVTVSGGADATLTVKPAGVKRITSVAISNVGGSFTATAAAGAFPAEDWAAAYAKARIVYNYDLYTEEGVKVDGASGSEQISLSELINSKRAGFTASNVAGMHQILTAISGVPGLNPAVDAPEKYELATGVIWPANFNIIVSIKAADWAPINTDVKVNDDKPVDSINVAPATNKPKSDPSIKDTGSVSSGKKSDGSEIGPDPVPDATVLNTGNKATDSTIDNAVTETHSVELPIVNDTANSLFLIAKSYDVNNALISVVVIEVEAGADLLINIPRIPVNATKVEIEVLSNIFGQNITILSETISLYNAAAAAAAE